MGALEYTLIAVLGRLQGDDGPSENLNSPAAATKLLNVIWALFKSTGRSSWKETQEAVPLTIALVDCGEYKALEGQVKARETIEPMTSEGHNAWRVSLSLAMWQGKSRKLWNVVVKARSKAESGIASFAMSFRFIGEWSWDEIGTVSEFNRASDLSLARIASTSDGATTASCERCLRSLREQATRLLLELYEGFPAKATKAFDEIGEAYAGSSVKMPIGEHVEASKIVKVTQQIATSVFEVTSIPGGDEERIDDKVID